MTDYQSPPGMHRHKCYRCGHVWEHDDKLDVVHDHHHECPACRECNWAKGIYDGSEEPDRSTKGPIVADAIIWKQGPPPVRDDGAFVVVRLSHNYHYDDHPVMVRLFKDAIIAQGETDHSGASFRYEQVEMYLELPPWDKH